MSADNNVMQVVVHTVNVTQDMVVLAPNASLVFPVSNYACATFFFFFGPSIVLLCCIINIVLATVFLLQIIFNPESHYLVENINSHNV